MKIEKLRNGLWVPSNDGQIEQWREKGYPIVQEKCLNHFKEWCESQNKKFNLIVDIGAWCGTWSIAMQKYAKNIHCYEPNKKHFACLERNLASYNHVRLYNQAIGNQDGFIKLLEESATQNTRVLLEEGETRISKLDSLDTEGIDMIKIDVEGLEMEVLKGASDKLKNIKFIMLELNSNSERYGSSNIKITTYLEEIGFKLLIKTWPDQVYYKI
jgi:FkbM family methyltransferase